MADSATNSSSESFLLAEWQIEPARNLLHRKRQQVTLQPRHMDLLCRLARSPLEVVARQQLIDEVWPRKGVEDDVLSRSIAEIRSALDDDARKPRFIETVPLRGYRLLVTPRALKRRPWRLVAIPVALILGFSIIWLADEQGPKSGLTDLTLVASQITSRKGTESGISSSSDGDLIAFLATDGPERTLMLARADGSNQQLIASGAGLGGPDLSPDGRYLAYVSRQATGCQVMLQERDSELIRSLGHCWNNGESSTAFSPDGQSLAFTAGDAEQAGIALFDLNTGRVRPLTDPGPAFVDLRPRFSPDGQWLSFSRGDVITRELFKVPLSGGDAEQLTFDRQLAIGHTWIDAGHLAFASDRMARQALWLLNLADKGVRPLGAVGGYGPYYLPGKDLLFFELARYEANIYSVDLNDPQAGPVLALNSSRYDNHPVFSFDGRQMAFVSNRSGLSAVWLADTDGGNAIKRYEVSDARVSRPSFSPQGQLLVSVYGPDGSSLHELDVAGDGRVVLSAAGINASAGVYSPDGEEIYYLDERDGSPAVWRFDRSLNLSRPIPGLIASRIQWGGDGRLYFTRPEIAGIHAVDRNGANPEPVIVDFPVWDWNDWCTAGQGLYYSTGSGVVRRDLVDGSERRVSTISPNAIGITVGVDPLESRLFMSRTDDARIDIYASPLKVSQWDD
jgi:Tol biopolymer transport system component/DNA-binding winged helix-turn-helix (wHTH) protein